MFILGKKDIFGMVPKAQAVYQLASIVRHGLVRAHVSLDRLLVYIASNYSVNPPTHVTLN